MLDTVDFGCVEPDELTNAMVYMHDPVPGFQVRVCGFGDLGFGHGAAARLRTAPAENFAVREQVLLDIALVQDPATGY